jgi:hypothetical protein
VSFFWAKVGKAKLNANPARASSKEIFILATSPNGNSLRSG